MRPTATTRERFEAIRLTRQLTLATEEPEARGLLALMLLNHARLPARRDSEGRGRGRHRRLHDDPASAEETDWPQILAWYDDLVALTDDPVRQDPAAVLGRSVAVGHVLGARGVRKSIGRAIRWFGAAPAS